MPIIIKSYSTNGIEQPEWNSDRTWDADTLADSEGYLYTFGPNERKSIIDDGRGLAISAAGVDQIVADTIPYGNAQS